MPDAVTTRELAHEMARLEHQALQAELIGADAEAGRLWALREEVQKQRSKLLRDRWAERRAA